MRRISVLLLALCCAAAQANPLGGLTERLERGVERPTEELQRTLEGVVRVPDALPGRYLVVLRDDQPAGRLVNDLLRRHGGVADIVFDRVLNGFAAYLTETQVAALQADRRVRYIEQDALRRTSLRGGEDPPWGLDRIAQRRLPLDGRFRPVAAGEGANLYIVDTGILRRHQDFGERVGEGVNTTDRPGRPPAGLLDGLLAGLFGPPADPDDPTHDCNGHGTHVAGTAAGSAFGVAGAARLYPVRVLNCEGAGATSTVIAGLDWIAENARRPAVVNMSLGGGASRALDEAVEKLNRRGLLVVAAAGNEDSDACQSSPARADKALTVASSDRNDRRSGFSNHGRCVDIFAPGSDIPSAWHTGDRASNTLSGTSMAAPHVAGAAALLLEKDDGLSPRALREKLLESATTGRISDRKGSPNRLLYVTPQEQ